MFKSRPRKLSSKGTTAKEANQGAALVARDHGSGREELRAETRNANCVRAKVTVGKIEGGVKFSSRSESGRW